MTHNPMGIDEFLSEFELIYSLKYRHVNQETLGLVFDTLKENVA